MLPQDLVQSILKAEWAQLPASVGRIKFNSVLKSVYIGISSPQIIKFLAEQEDHQRYRQRRRSQRSTTTVSTAPFKILATDLTDVPSRGGLRYLLVVTDLFTKMAWVQPIKRKSGDIVAREIGRIIDSLPSDAKVGVLKSDNGTEFKNPELRAVLESHGVKQVFSTPGVPAGNGAVESLNRTLKELHFSFLQGDNAIASFAPAVKRIVRLYNNTLHTATGFTPTQLNSITVPPDVIKQVRDKSKLSQLEKSPT